jgi:competence protein ComFC
MSLETTKQDMIRWLQTAVGLVYPRNCQACRVPLLDTEVGVVCRSCLATAKPIEPPFCDRCALPFAGAIDGPFVCGYCADLKFHFRRVVAACRAEGVVRDCIHRFKYNREMYYERHLVDWLLPVAQRAINWQEVDALIPVPLHPRKRRSREFNQAEALADAVGRTFKVPVKKRQLRRVKETVTQTALGAAERRQNLREAFLVRRAGEIDGQRLVLVDDVFTTGATLDNCAKVLREAGAKDVIALTVARGI